jgi:potassium efflux system protein
LQWPEAALRSLRTSLLKVMTCGLPIVFGVSLTENWQDGLWSDSLGRILFVIGMGLLATSLRRILRPNGPVLCEAFRRSQDGWLCRGRRIWYPAVVSVPLVLAGLALAGFQFTAEQLLIRVEATFWLAIVLLIAFTLAMRWLLAMRKRVALEQARARQAAVLAAAQTGDASEELKVLPQVEEPTIDVSHLSLQMLRLVRVAACVLFLTGSWFIWGQVLPALQMFHGVELWNTTVQVSEEVELADGQIESRMVTKPRAVTLGILLLAAGLLLTAIVASRNIPGLLELAILQRLPLDHGARNAVTTLCRYLFSLGGIILAARMVGIGWSSVQWLIAALTVGLGFGLQEIFANFVSGLIILFERPVRIGDVVTIDGVSGVISRIQIRATTVTDFDRKEYLVPNKEFVTGRVLNWTLTDKTNRIVITVGVAYGSNTEHARNLLARVAEEHPLVLDDPAPVATFEGFGDSCLTLLLRCYLPNLDNRLKTITELHEAIDREFRNNDLEIAFPQRDIHIRSMTTVPLASHSSPSTLAAQSDERKAA